MEVLLDDTLRLAKPFRETPRPVEVDAIVRSDVAERRTDPLFQGIDLRVDLGATPSWPSPTRSRCARRSPISF
jgi:hypothetical protein